MYWRYTHADKWNELNWNCLSAPFGGCDTATAYPFGHFQYSSHSYVLLQTHTNKLHTVAYTHNTFTTLELMELTIRETKHTAVSVSRALLWLSSVFLLGCSSLPLLFEHSNFGREKLGLLQFYSFKKYICDSNSKMKKWTKWSLILDNIRQK